MLQNVKLQKVFYAEIQKLLKIKISEHLHQENRNAESRCTEMRCCRTETSKSPGMYEYGRYKSGPYFETSSAHTKIF